MKNLFLVDCTNVQSNFLTHLSDLGWWQRFENVKNATFSLNSNMVGQEFCKGNFQTWRELTSFCRRKNYKNVVVCNPDQMFLDLDVISAGLTKLNELNKKWDYFTQWEHTRLPVGVGARVLSLECDQVKKWQGDVNSLIQHIIESPSSFFSHYDDNRYVKYEESLLDSRYHAKYLRNVAGNLKDFEELLSNSSGLANDIRYSEMERPDFVMKEVCHLVMDSSLWNVLIFLLTLCLMLLMFVTRGVMVVRNP